MIRNTELSYGSVAKCLHWLTALLILVAYILVLYLEYVLHGEGPMRSPVIRLHKAIGASILVFIVLRIWWRATNPNPKLPDSMPKWQVTVSHMTHFSLYALLVAMPISGYLGNGNGVSIGLFAIPGFAKTAIGAWTLNLLGLTFEQWEVPFDFFHKNIVGPFVLWVIITAHAGAAIYHHYVEKDDVLKRMLPEKRDRPLL
jgi:cytochrome b561